MVERAGDETIVRVDWPRVRTYYILGWVVALLAAAFVCYVLFSGALREIPSTATAWFEWLGILVWIAILARTGWGLLLLAPRISQVFVAIGPGGVRLRLLQGVHEIRPGLTSIPQYSAVFLSLPTLGPEEYYVWDEIGGISRDEDETLLFHARDRLYKLSDGNCPPPFVVAQLLAEGLGVKLPPTRAELKAARTGKKPMPRMKQAALLAKIGFALLGLFAAQVLWVYNSGLHLEDFETNAFFRFVLLGTLLVGVAAGTLLFTAIFMVIIQ